jgi:hypothetical protein
MGTSILFQFKNIMDFSKDLSKIPLKLMMLNNGCFLYSIYILTCKNFTNKHKTCV